MKSPITKLAAAAVIIIAVLIGIRTFTGATAWAKIVRAFNEVENVHIVSVSKSGDGVTEHGQYWIKRPSYIRVEERGVTIIDDGKKRLEINESKRTARLWESREPFEPVAEVAIFKMIGLFRSKLLRDYFEVQTTRLPDESSERIIVYEICYQRSNKGKAWVEAESMLLQRMVVAGEGQSTELVFEYEPIAQEVFSTVVPRGYTELPYIKHPSLSGRVVDEYGEPVPAAVVYALSQLGHYEPKSLTDEDGSFMVKLLPDITGGVLFPVFVRAFEIGVPNRVAWTLLEDPDESRKLGGTVPGVPGEIETMDASGMNKCHGATGIVLQMGPAEKITGRVTDDQGIPIASVTVRLNSCSLVDERDMPVYSHVKLGGPEMRVQTNRDGRFDFTNLPLLWEKWHFSISIHKDGYYGQVNGVNCPIGSREVNWRMWKAGVNITGRVINDLGEPLVGYYVSAVVDDSGRGYGMERTDENGRFKMTDCPIIPNMNMGIKVLGSLRMGDWKSNRLTKNRQFIYYPDTVVDIRYQPEKMDYSNVDIVVEKPDITLEIELRNTAGKPVKYFPIQVLARGLNHRWSEEKLSKRTDGQGRCIITEVPRIKDLQLLLWYLRTIRAEPLSQEQRKFKEENRKYERMQVPIKLQPSKKKYKISVTLLTHEEYQRKKREE